MKEIKKLFSRLCILLLVFFSLFSDNFMMESAAEIPNQPGIGQLPINAYDLTASSTRPGWDVQNLKINALWSSADSSTADITIKLNGNYSITRISVSADKNDSTKYYEFPAQINFGAGTTLQGAIASNLDRGPNGSASSSYNNDLTLAGHPNARFDYDFEQPINMPYINLHLTGGFGTLGNENLQLGFLHIYGYSIPELSGDKILPVTATASSDLLNNAATLMDGSGLWVADYSDTYHPFVDFSFARAYGFEGIKIYGRGDYHQTFPSSFKIYSSNDGVQYTQVKNGVFEGFKQMQYATVSPVVLKFTSSFTAKYIRIECYNPVTGNQVQLVKAEFFRQTGGQNGFSNMPSIMKDTYNYDEFYSYASLPADYASTALNAGELIADSIMTDKSNSLYNDIQKNVTQNGQYIFQNAGVSCKNPMDAYFVDYQGNPVAWGVNVYTPSIVKNGDTWYVYYGGWGTIDCVGNDTTYLMTTKDPDLRGPYKQYGKVLKAGGSYVHAQDASVAIGPDGIWVMAYTQTTINPLGKGVDWIGIATSSDGITWTAYGNSQSGISNSPNSEIKLTNYTRRNSTSAGYDIIGRPSIRYNSNLSRWEMYADSVMFEGDMSNQASIYLFTSTEKVPINWKYETKICTGGETALAVIDNKYFLAFNNDLTWPGRMKVMSGDDGIHFSEPKAILTGERMTDGTIQHVTNMAFAVDNNEIKAIMYGRSKEGWSHKVSLAYPQKKISVWRGGQLLTEDAITAENSQTQLVDSKGSTSPVTKIKVYDQLGKTSSFEMKLNLYPGQSKNLTANTQAPAKPLLISPYNNEEKVLWGTNFFWSPVSMASRYELQIASDSGFNNIIFAKDNILICQYKLHDPLPMGNTYYWRIIAKNTKGYSISDANRFTVLGTNQIKGEYIHVAPNSISGTDDGIADSNIKNILDGWYYTFWTGTYNSTNNKYPSFTLDYGRQYPISRLVWQPRVDLNAFPSSIKIEYSTDGKTYHTLSNSDCLSSNNFSGFAINYIPKNITLNRQINMRFIRFTITGTNGFNEGGISEFKALILR